MSSVAPLDSGGLLSFCGSDLGIFQHSSGYSVVTPENPARPGETIIAYVTGMPGTRPQVPTGEAAPYDALAVVPQDSYSFFVDRYYLFPTHIHGLSPRDIL